MAEFEHAAKWAFWGGLTTAMIGGVTWAFLRGKRASEVFGRAIEQKKAGGMVLQHYRSRMPIRERVGYIQDHVWEGVKDPRMRKIALGITHTCAARDDMCELRAVYNAVKQRVRYTGDIGPVKMGRNGPVEGIDVFSSPYRTWEMRGEDCDGHSGLTATLAAHNGFATRLRVTSPTRRRGQQDWSHIYAVAGVPRNAPAKWIALDTTLPGDRFNYEAPYGKKLDFPA